MCVIAHVTPEGEEHLFEGRCEGTLAAEPSGAGGFGYDPLFVADECPDRTMAELSDEEKDAISHRGHAARELLAWLDSTKRRSEQASTPAPQPRGSDLDRSRTRC